MSGGNYETLQERTYRLTGNVVNETLAERTKRLSANRGLLRAAQLLRQGSHYVTMAEASLKGGTYKSGDLTLCTRCGSELIPIGEGFGCPGHHVKIQG